MPLYLYLILLTPLFPILLSFDKRVHFVSNWKWAILATIPIAIPFLIWDELFTDYGVWGFTPKYLVGAQIGNLPVEEISFFFVVPFACTFIYECVRYYFRNVKLSTFNRIFYVAFLGYCSLILVNNPQGWYSLSAVGTGIIGLGILLKNREKYKFIPLAYLFSLIPFFVVNGILTGSFIEDQIVWYNLNHFSGIRIFTIPIEDAVYGWTLIVFNIFVFVWLKNRVKRARK